MKKWPNFFVVGAPKAGTSTLYQILKNVPQVYMSKVKEPGYFNIGIDLKSLFVPMINDEKNYLKLFNNAKDEIAIGELTTTYLMDPEAPKKIRQVIPNARIIIMLRNPIERAFSHYLHHKRTGLIVSPFNDVINMYKNSLIKKNDLAHGIICEGGFYYEQVKRYLDIFPSENVKIFIYEEFFKDIQKSLHNLLSFLKIKNYSFDLVNEVNVYAEPKDKLSKSILQSKKLKEIARNVVGTEFSQKIASKFFLKTSTKPKILDKDRKLLKDIYLSDIKKLQELLGRTLPWS